MDDNNVMIPLSLLKRIIDLLCLLNIHGYEDWVQDEHADIIDALFLKLQRLEVRKAYSKIVYAKTENDRHNARMEYLEQRRMLKNPF